MKTKTILITGSTSGIGLGIARAFANEGHNIIFNGLETNGLQIAEAVASEFSISYMFSSANMLRAKALYDMVGAATEKFGVIDVLIKTGIQHVSSIEEFPAQKWDDIIGINLTAAFHLTKAVWCRYEKPTIWKDH